jgi:hypothetical protein
VAGLQRSLGATRAASVGGGLATPAVATTQTLVAYATAAKVVAADGAEGARNSPFTAALVKHLVEPEDIRIVFGRVRGSVVAATDGTQRPDIWGSLGGERIVLAPPEATAQDLEATLTPSERAAIRASLRDLGYLQSTEIGRFGYATRAAIREFQLAQGAPGTSFLNVPQMVQLHTLPGAAVLWHKHATGVQGRSSPMSKSSVLAVMVAASLVVWVAAALTGEAADRPAERGQPSPVNDPAGLQRFLNRGEPGVGRVTPTTDDWIDPVCTGYGPGLGPPTRPDPRRGVRAFRGGLRGAPLRPRRIGRVPAAERHGIWPARLGRGRTRRPPRRSLVPGARRIVPTTAGPWPILADVLRDPGRVRRQVGPLVGTVPDDVAEELAGFGLQPGRERRREQPRLVAQRDLVALRRRPLDGGRQREHGGEHEPGDRGDHPGVEPAGRVADHDRGRGSFAREHRAAVSRQPSPSV